MLVTHDPEVEKIFAVLAEIPIWKAKLALDRAKGLLNAAYAAPEEFVCTSISVRADEAPLTVEETLCSQ